MNSVAYLGVGKVQLFGGEKALRIWLDPMKYTAMGSLLRMY